MQALSTESYSAAKAHSSALEDWLCCDQRILRQDSVYTIDPLSLSQEDTRDTGSPSRLEYRLIMSEPVLQGYAQKGQTSFVLLPPTEVKPGVNGDVATGSSFTEELNSDFGDDDLEIDEGFLANSLGRHLGTNSHATNGHSGLTNGAISTDNTASTLHQAFIASPLPGDIHPDLDDHTVYIRTADLTKVGILDGDWVSA